MTVHYDNFESVHTVAEDVSPNWKEEFPECFNNKIGTLPGDPVHLTLKPDSQLTHRPARTLPESLKMRVKDEIDE